MYTTKRNAVTVLTMFKSYFDLNWLSTAIAQVNDYNASTNCYRNDTAAVKCPISRLDMLLTDTAAAFYQCSTFWRVAMCSDAALIHKFLLSTVGCWRGSGSRCLQVTLNIQMFLAACEQCCHLLVVPRHHRSVLHRGYRQFHNSIKTRVFVALGARSTLEALNVVRFS